MKSLYNQLERLFLLKKHPFRSNLVPLFQIIFFMKNKILVLFLFLSVIGFAQNKETLQVEVEKMYEASYVLDYDAILTYTHPKLFDFASKDQMTAVMQNMFENEDFKIRFVHPKVNFTYSEFQKIDGTTYCVINYNGALRMTFEKKLNNTEIDEMKKKFADSKEYEKITYEPARNSFLIEGKSTLIAIHGEATQNQWRFVNYSASQAQLAKMILSEEIVTKLGLN